MNNSFSWYPWFKVDALNSFVLLAIGLFSILTLVYSFGFMKGKRNLIQYYTCIVLTGAASTAAVLSNNLILLLIFWGFLGLTLYLLIGMGQKGSDSAAKKAFIIVGGADMVMLLGIGILYYLTGTFQMDKIHIPLSLRHLLPLAAYLCIAVGCFAKAGAMPFHSWIPVSAETGPVPAIAYLPASLDKLLGIYLLARVSLDLFAMNRVTNVLLMLVGAFTIIVAVMMALVQHNMKKLLGYHAVSQVGYMILGIGTATPIGVAGGMFHMLNNAVYKSCLFLTAGNVEYRAHTTELDELGGLAKIMPITYISCLIASLSICGVPLFNGFVSKWMIYQGIIGNWQMASSRWQVIVALICLAAAMFGSALTLASFMKLIHAAFLGQPKNSRTPGLKNEVNWTMWFPCVVLASICVVFGIFANQIPLKYFIIPAVKDIAFTGAWHARTAALLIFIGLLLGIFIFRLKGVKPIMHRDAAFVGSETEGLDLDEAKVSGTEFYNTVKEVGLPRLIYQKAEAGLFDVYEQAKRIFSFSKALQYLHNGVLQTYLIWMLLGMAGLFLFLLK